MNTVRTKERLIFAAGSAMEISPLGDYSEYLPKGTTSQRIGDSWREAGKTINKSIENYASIATRHS